MPYIEQHKRSGLKPGASIAENPGELNFQLTTAITEYMVPKVVTYQVLNDILGALEGAKLEFYRRVVVPYENNKRDENGDMY